jgi:FeS assembly SUF system regulator
MLRIGKLTDYALLILGQMAREASLVSATAIAEALHLSAPTVSKILKMLSEAGLVSSVRGAEGGYQLIRDAAHITVAEVITAMEGGVAMTECCENSRLCVIDPLCAMKENWIKINKKVHDILAGISIVDMLEVRA